MTNALYLLLGALLGGAINIIVQLYLRRVDRHRERRLACRVLIGEFGEIASAMINTETARYDPRPIHDAWRAHRAALTDLGADAWHTLDSAVMQLVYPDHFPPEIPSSNPLLDRMDLAFIVLERYATLPAGLRYYE
jgi:hypothetical protein